MRIKEYLDNYGTYENEELIIGNWIEAWDDSNDEANKIVSFLVDNKEKFTNLKAYILEIWILKSVKYLG